MSSFTNEFKLDNISPLIKNQFPDFFNDDDSKLPSFLNHYYRYLECQHFHFINIVYSEYRPILEDGSTDGFALEQGDGDAIIFESERSDTSAFETGEILTGDTSKATGELRGVQNNGVKAGKHSSTVPHHLFVVPLTGKFKIGESFTGSKNRTRATLKSIDDKGALNFSRSVLDAADVFNTDEDFLEIFRKEFIPNIPRTAKTELKKLIPLAKDIYKSRGSENSFTFLWRSVYNKDDLEFLYPKDFVLKVSDSNWNRDNILFVDSLTATDSGKFAGRRVKGMQSLATAIVQRQSGITKGSNQIIQLFISDQEGDFITGEVVASDYTEDGIRATGVTVAAVDTISVVDGGTNYEVGDRITIAGGGGVEALATVNTVTDGAVNDIIVSDGGDGYFGTETFEYFIPGAGAGASSKATESTPSGVARIYGNTITVSAFASTQLNAADFGGGLTGVNANNHFYSNANNTFDITVGSSSNYAVGMLVADTSNNTIGTVVGVPDSTSIIYALTDQTIPNFYPGTNGSTISAYTADGSAVSSTSTTVTAVTSVTDTQYHGVLEVQEIPFGSIKDTEVLTVGKNYNKAPTIKATQPQISDFNNDDGILGPRTRFLNLVGNVEFVFKHGKEIQGESSGAAGIVLDPYIEKSSNSTLSVIRYKSAVTNLVIDSTDGSSNAGENLLLEDGYAPSHGSYQSESSFAGQFRMEEVDFTPSEKIIQLTTTANAVTMHSNVVTIDNSRRGNNAVIVSGNLSIGSITSIDITDFGIGFYSTPTVTATEGDGNAILEATIGASAQKGGEYSNEDGLLSGKDKIQDSFYYQDYSYVLKTDLPVSSFRDTVKSFIHPAGWALFGEISFRTEMSLASEFTEGPFTRIIELPAFSVNFMSANANITQYHIRFIEGLATITFNPSTDTEYLYKFPVPNTIDLPDTNLNIDPELEFEFVENVTHQVTSEKELAYELVEDVSYQNFIDEVQMEKYLDLDVAPLPTPSSDSFPELESERTTSVTHTSHSQVIEVESQPTSVMSMQRVAMTRSVWEKIGISAFAEADSPVIRTMPTIQDWYNTYQIPSQGQTVTIETLYNQEINMLAGPQYAPKVKKDDEIFIPSIDSVLESNGKLLLTGGSDDGDDILLEDGMSEFDVLTAQSLEAAEALVTGDIVIQNANSTVSKANTTNITASNFKGIVNGSFSATQTASVLGNGFTTHVTSRTLTVDATHYVTGTSPFFSTTPGTPSVVLGKGVANNGVTSTYTAGENLTNGDFIMLNDSNQAVKLDMSAASLTHASDVHDYPHVSAANSYNTQISIDKANSNTTSGTFAVTYIRKTGSSPAYKLHIRMATYSGLAITYGTEQDLGGVSAPGDFPVDIQFSATTGKFLHIHNSDIKAGYYSGTTPTLGSATTYSGDFLTCDPNPNDGAQWLVARGGFVCIATVGSGATNTTVTLGTEVAYDTGNTSREPRIEWDPHTTGRFVISWRRANEGGDMYSRIGSVSGTTITWDDNIYEVGSNNGSANYEHHWDPKQSGQIIYCYNESGDNYLPKVRVGTVSAGGAISFGTETLLYDDSNDAYDEGVNLARVEFFQDTGKMMFVLASSVTASKGYYLFGDVSNAGVLTLDTSVTNFSTDYIYNVDMDSVNGIILTTFQDGHTYGGASGDDGAYVFATTHVASFQASSYVGVVDANYTSGATATVQGMGMTDDAQSGLDGSSIYYFTDASPAGLSTSGTVIAGKAVSATQIRIGDPTKTNSVLVGGEVVDEYSSTTSKHGFLLAESDRFVYEDNTSLNRKGIPYWQKEEAKYIVKSSNSTSFTVGGAGHSNYLPVGLHDFNTEAFVLRNRS